MKVCLYYRTINKPWGGSNSFIANLKDFFLTQGVEVTFDANSHYDILLLNGAYKAPGKMLKIKEISSLRRLGYSSSWMKIFRGPNRRRLKIIYRLDGLRSIYAGKRSRMDDIQLACIDYADHIIFQSKFAHEIFRQQGYDRNNFTFIHNGADQKIFNMDGKIPWNGKDIFKLIACSWSLNPSKGHRMIAEFSLLKGVEVSFIGRWPEKVNRHRVKLHGIAGHKQIAGMFKQAHAFLFPCLHEACSNVLIEALSSGLPVLYVASGSNAEIVGNCGVCIDISDIKTSLDQIRENYGDLYACLEGKNRGFSIEHAGRRYLDICNSLMVNS